MKHFKTFVFLTFSTFFLASCNKQKEDEKCLYFLKAPVTKVEGITTALVNQEITLDVYFSCNNGCGQFGNFEESISGNTTTIVANAKYEGCICTDILLSIKATYKFKKAQSGTYQLKFLQRENTYLTYTIIVQ